MKRREFTAGICAAAWPIAVQAQQGDRVRRVGVLMNLTNGDPEGRLRVAAFQQGLEELSWTEGHNI
jgi:putative tryptophan/tyrosine transport system substrate-binding protein